VFETKVNTNDHYIQEMEGQIIELRSKLRNIRGLIVERYRQAYPEEVESIDDIEYSIEMIDVLIDGCIHSYDIDDPAYKVYFNDNGIWIMEHA
jgi:hypothetical protein